MRLKTDRRYAAKNRPPLCGYKKAAAMRLKTDRRYAAKNRAPLCG
jgi:hypothetical protein